MKHDSLAVGWSIRTEVANPYKVEEKNCCRHVILSTNTTSSTTLICRVHGDGYCVRIRDSCSERRNCLGERCSSLDDCPGPAQVKCMKERCGVEHTCESDNQCPFEMQCVDSECVTRESCPDLLTCLIGRLMLCSNGVCRSLSKSGASHPSQQYVIFGPEEHQSQTMFPSGFLDEEHGKLAERSKLAHPAPSPTSSYLGNDNYVEEEVEPHNEEQQKYPFQWMKVVASKAPYRGVVLKPGQSLTDLYPTSSEDSEEDTGIDSSELHPTPTAPLSLPNRGYPGRLLKLNAQKPTTASASTPNADNTGYRAVEAIARNGAPGETSSSTSANASDETQNSDATSDEDSEEDATEAQLPIARAAPFRKRLLQLPLPDRSLVGATATLDKFIRKAGDELNSFADSVPTSTVEAVPAKPLEESLKQAWTSAPAQSSSAIQASSHGSTNASVTAAPFRTVDNFSNEQSIKAASEETSKEEGGIEVTPTTDETSASSPSPETDEKQKLSGKAMPSTTSTSFPTLKEPQVETVQARPLEEALKETSTSASTPTAAVATSSATRRASPSRINGSATPTPLTTTASAFNETQGSDAVSDESSEEETAAAQLLSTTVAQTSTTEATEVEETAVNSTVEEASATTPSSETVASQEPLDATISPTTTSPSWFGEGPQPKIVQANSHDQAQEGAPTSAPAQTASAAVASTNSTSETVTLSTTVARLSKETQSRGAASDEASGEEGAVANSATEEEPASTSPPKEITSATTSTQSPVTKTSRPKIMQAEPLDKGISTSVPAQSATVVIPSWTMTLATTEKPITAADISNEIQNTDASSDEDSNVEAITEAQILSPTAARPSTTQKPTASDAPVNAALVPAEVGKVDKSQRKTEEALTTLTPDNPRAMETHDTPKGTLTSALVRSTTVPTSPTTGATPDEALPSTTSTPYPTAGNPTSSIISRKEPHNKTSTTAPAQTTTVATSSTTRGTASVVEATSTATADPSKKVQSKDAVSGEPSEKEGAGVAPEVEGASVSTPSSEKAVTLKDSSNKSPDEAVLSSTSAPSPAAVKYQPKVVSTEKPPKQTSSAAPAPAQSTTVATSPSTAATPDEAAPPTTSTPYPPSWNPISTITPPTEPQNQTSTTVPAQTTTVATSSTTQDTIYGDVDASVVEATSTATVEPSKEVQSKDAVSGEPSEEEGTEVAPAVEGASASTPSSEEAVTLKNSSNKSPEESVLSTTSAPSPATVKYQRMVVSSEPGEEAQKQTSTTVPAQTTTVAISSTIQGTAYGGKNASVVEATSTTTVEPSKEVQSKDAVSGEPSEEGTEVAPAVEVASASTPPSEEAVTLKDSSNKSPEEAVLSTTSAPSPATVKYQSKAVSNEPREEPQKQTSTTVPAQTTTVATSSITQDTIYGDVDASVVEATSTATVEPSKEVQSNDAVSGEPSEEGTEVAPAVEVASASTPPSEEAVTLKDSSNKSPDEAVLSTTSVPSPAAVKYQSKGVSNEPREEPQNQTSTTVPAQTTTVATSSATQDTIYGDVEASVVEATSTATVEPSKNTKSSDDASSEALEEGAEVAPATDRATASISSSETVAKKKPPDGIMPSTTSASFPILKKLQVDALPDKALADALKKTSTSAPTQPTTSVTPSTTNGVSPNNTNSSLVATGQSTNAANLQKKTQGNETTPEEILEEETAVNRDAEQVPATAQEPSDEITTTNPSKETQTIETASGKTSEDERIAEDPTTERASVLTPPPEALKTSEEETSEAQLLPTTVVRTSTAAEPDTASETLINATMEAAEGSSGDKSLQTTEAVSTMATSIPAVDNPPEKETHEVSNGTSTADQRTEGPSQGRSNLSPVTVTPSTTTADFSKQSQSSVTTSEETFEKEEAAVSPKREEASETVQAQILPYEAAIEDFSEEAQSSETGPEKISEDEEAAVNLETEGAQEAPGTWKAVETAGVDFSKETQGTETVSEKAFEDEKTAVGQATEEASETVQAQKLPHEAAIEDFSEEAQSSETGPEKISEDEEAAVNLETEGAQEAPGTWKAVETAGVDFSKETQGTETVSEKAFEDEKTAVGQATEEASETVQAQKLPHEAAIEDFSEEAQSSETGPEKISEDEEAAVNLETEGAQEAPGTWKAVETAGVDFSKETQGTETVSEKAFEDEKTAVGQATEEASETVQAQKLPHEAATVEFSKGAEKTETGPEKISEDEEETEVNSATEGAPETVEVHELPNEVAMDDFSKETQSTETASEDDFEDEETAAEDAPKTFQAQKLRDEAVADDISKEEQSTETVPERTSENEGAAVSPAAEETSTPSAEEVRSFEREVTQAQIQSTTRSSGSVTTSITMEDSSDEGQSITATSREDSEVGTTEAPSGFSNAVALPPKSGTPIVFDRLVNPTMPPVKESRRYKPLQNTTGHQNDEHEAPSSTVAPSQPAPTATIAAPTAVNARTRAETESPDTILSNETLKSGAPMTAVQLPTLAPESGELHDVLEDQTDGTDRIAVESNSPEQVEATADPAEWEPLPSWTLKIHPQPWRLEQERPDLAQ